MKAVLIFSRVLSYPFELFRYPGVDVLLFLKVHVLFRVRKMACKCKKRGSGAHFLSGVTWHKGSGMKVTGGGLYKKRRKKKRGSGGPQMFMYKGHLRPTHGGGFHRRKKKKKGGMSITGGGVNFQGSGFPISGGAAMQWVLNKKRNGRRVI